MLIDDITLKDIQAQIQDIKSTRSKSYHCSNCRNEIEAEMERRIFDYAEDTLLPALKEYFEDKERQQMLR